MSDAAKPPGPWDIFDDLVAEQDRLDAVLAAMSADLWRAASAAAGWSVADVVLHLAQTEEAVLATVRGTVECGSKAERSTTSWTAWSAPNGPPPADLPALVDGPSSLRPGAAPDRR